MRLVAPDLNSRRARLADWLELDALTSARKQASVSGIRSQLRRVSDDRVSPKEIDIDADDSGEPEITDRIADDLEEKLYEELNFRVETVGPSYPFELITSKTGHAHTLRLRDSWAETQSGELIYIFCLLDSGIRDGLLACSKAAQPLVRAIATIFQICSCIAVAGYTNGEVVSFGFPRAEGNDFLPALQAAWGRYGSYAVYGAIPYGFDDRLKDGGVDIIAWRHFGDAYAATFIMFVQVASGLDWKDKEVSADVKALRKWFNGLSFDHFLPAICIPFPLWFDLDEPPEDLIGHKLSFKDGVRNRFMVREGKFGIIFDRGRIARSSAYALSFATESPGAPQHPVDGINRVSEVGMWVHRVLSTLADARGDT